VTARARAVVLVWIVFLAACAVLASRVRACHRPVGLPADGVDAAQRVLVDQLRGRGLAAALIGLEGRDRPAGRSDTALAQHAAAPEFAYATSSAEDSMQAEARFF
jgi:predicted exporter